MPYRITEKDALGRGKELCWEDGIATKDEAETKKQSYLDKTERGDEVELTIEEY